MTLIARDLVIGNPGLKTLGFGEEALGHNAIGRLLIMTISGEVAIHHILLPGVKCR